MRLFAVLCALLFATASTAADLSVGVRTSAGRPVADAVVTLYPASGAAPVSEARFDWPIRMAQQNLQFSPFVLIVPQGATVAFPNLDKVRHHVYSFSPAHPFELKLYGHDETRTVRFDHVGVIALGCNIHDQMIAFIKVVDTPYAAKTGPDGEAVLRDVPPGAAVVRVWHPYMKTPANEVVSDAVMPHAGTVRESFNVEVRTPPERKSVY
jgi:plastocyanin